MLLATTLVAVVPAVAAWWLRQDGVLGSALACLLFCILLSVGLSIAGAAYWKRSRHSADIMFSELLAWGWVRRLWRERQLRNVPALLESAAVGHQSDQLTVERRHRMLEQLATAIEAQDPYIDGHSRRVARHSAMIAEKLKLPGEQVARIRTAGALHDVGKLSTPSEVLRKPGRLTDQEYEVIKRHARDGAQMVSCLEDPELTAIVGCHHERLDGSGYPQGLEAAQIPLGARIVAVADIFDAITAPRPYRPAAPHQKAFAVLSSEQGTRLDAEVVDAFIRCYSGRSTVALWAALTALPARALARSRGLLAGRRLTVRDVLNTMTAMGTAAVVAVAAPLSAQASHRAPPRQPVAAVASTLGAAPRVLHVHHAARVRHRPRSRPHAAVHNPRRHRAAVAQPAPPASRPQPPAPPRSPAQSARPRSPRTPTHRHHRSPPPPGKTTRPAPPPPTTSTPTPPPIPSPPPGPTSKQQCMKGGYVRFKFPNQGQCIAWVVHHRR